MKLTLAPDEFERQSERGNLADSPGATVEFVVNENSENEQRGSKKLAREEESNAVLSLDPFSC